MVQKHQKIIDFLLFGILPAGLIHTLYLLLFKTPFSNDAILMITGSIIVLGILPWIFYHTHENEDILHDAQHQIWMLLFLVYVFQLAYLLFFSADFARDKVNLLDGNYGTALQIQWENGTNLMPFKTIKQVMIIFDIPAISNQIAIINLFGNFIAFMPFSFFLPKLFPCMKKARCYLPCIACIIIAVEVTQFFTLTGTMDIDDFILNFGGALLCYLPLYSIYHLHNQPYKNTSL